MKNLLELLATVSAILVALGEVLKQINRFKEGIGKIQNPLAPSTTQKDSK